MLQGKEITLEYTGFVTPTAQLGDACHIKLDIILLVWSLSPLLHKCNRSHGIKKVFLFVLLETEQKLLTARVVPELFHQYH